MKKIKSPGHKLAQGAKYNSSLAILIRYPNCESLNPEENPKNPALAILSLLNN